MNNISRQFHLGLHCNALSKKLSRRRETARRSVVFRNVWQAVFTFGQLPKWSILVQNNLIECHFATVPLF